MKMHCGAVRSVAPGCTLALLFIGVLIDSASATGFFVNQQSVRGRGRVDAGNTAAADELGTAFFNPAGLIQLWQQDALGDTPRSRPADLLVSAGVQVVWPRNTQNDTGSTISSPGTGGVFVPYDGPGTHNPTDPTPIPNVYVARRLAGGDAAVALTVNGPFGLSTKSSSDWFGRYDAIEAALFTANIGVVGAYRLAPTLFVGGGVDVQYAHTKLITAVPDPLGGVPSPATDARSDTRGHAWTPGFNVGVMYVPDKDTRFGVHYRSRMKHEIEGSATLTGLQGPFAPLNGTYAVRADVKLPAIATVGAWRRVTDRLAVMADAEWYWWSTFDEVRTRFDAPGFADQVRETRYRDTWGIAVGAEYHEPGAPLALRGGIKVDRTPTVNRFRDTTVPDSDRLWLGLGASYRLSPTRSIDFAFNHVFFRDASVHTTRTFFAGTGADTTVVINGSMNPVVNTFAVDFHWAF